MRPHAAPAVSDCSGFRHRFAAVLAAGLLVAGGAQALAQVPTPTPVASPSPAATETPVDEALLKEIEKSLGAAATPTPAPGPAAGAAGARGQANYFNPAMSLDGLFAGAVSSEAEPLPEEGAAEEGHHEGPGGAHDPRPNAFTMQNLELTVSAAVDPYFTARSHIIFGKDSIEVEEAYATTTSLPWGLQLKAGQFFTQFGRQNAVHPHAWAFADQNLANVLAFGGDGLRNPGAQLSWLTPLPFYVELILAAQDARGETASSFLPEDGRVVDSIGEALYTGRTVFFIPLGEDLSVLLGASGAVGPNAAGPDTQTFIGGGDLYVKWKPADRAFFNAWLQAEGVARQYGLGDDVFQEDEGLAVQLGMRFAQRWETAVRGETTSSDDLLDPDAPAWRNRWSGQLTFRPSEFSKLRLQGNVDQHAGEADPIYTGILQVEFLIGAHGAHAF